MDTNVTLVLEFLIVSRISSEYLGESHRLLFLIMTDEIYDALCRNLTVSSQELKYS